MIISVSRRTDIPAFYTPWLLNRLKAGFVLIKNPFNRKVSRVSLLPEDVDAFVFWTRNASMLMKNIDALKDYNYYFQYTITGYPKAIEKNVKSPYKTIENFVELSNIIGKEKIIWRYDPILISNTLTLNEHKRLFTKIADNLVGKTNKVVISFADFYKKTIKNLSLIENFKYIDILNEEAIMNELVKFMVKIANDRGMMIETCAESIDLSYLGVQHGKCIDDRLLKKVFNINFSSKKDIGQREACGCIKSIDIGEYNTCLHNCTYCYATYDLDSVKNNKLKHSSDSPFLIGDAKDVDPELLIPAIKQGSLF